MANLFITDPILQLAHIEDITFLNLARDLKLHLVWPSHGELRKSLTFSKVYLFKMSKDDEEEACFSIIDYKFEYKNEGGDLLRSIGGSNYSEDIGPVQFCRIYGCAEITIVCRDYQVS